MNTQNNEKKQTEEGIEKLSKEIGGMEERVRQYQEEVLRQRELLAEKVREAENTGTEVFLAGAGLSAALPGVVASLTVLPVIGIPLDAGKAAGFDSLLSVVQMPKQIPVAAVGLDNAENAAWLALEILAVEQAGESFNLKSTKQLGVVLFEKLGLPVIKKTKTGYSTDVSVLEQLRNEHPLVRTVLEHRKLTKLHSTYLEGLRPLINAKTGRIHTHFQQLVTVTGRLSSTDPNLQNIPTRTELGKQIREIFVPGEGYDYLLSCDYSQVELRVLAHIAQDELLLESFLHGQDVHARTAAEVFGVPLGEVTGTMRTRAKAVNFGIVYGISDFGLAKQLDISRSEAGRYIENYLGRYTGVKKYMDDMVASARKNGYVQTLFGRRRYLPDINSRNFNIRGFAERTAINTPIQGTAADIIKIAMINVQKMLEQGNYKSRILLQVHDELLLEVTADEREEVGKLVKQTMEAAVKLSVPLIADVNYGTNWANAK